MVILEIFGINKTLIFILVLTLCLATLCSCNTDAADIAGDYKIENNVYYAMLADKAYNPDDGYSIEEKDGKVLLFITHIGVSGENVKEEAGELKSFWLKKKQSGYSYHGRSMARRRICLKLAQE